MRQVRLGLDAEKLALASPDKQQVVEGAALQRSSTQAVELSLKPLAEARLAMPPERAPKQTDAFAAAMWFAAAEAGRFRITLPEAGYIDVIQNGRYLKPVAFTGAHDCPGLRKSVVFEIGPEAFTVQLSGVAAPVISIVMTPAN